MRAPANVRATVAALGDPSMGALLLDEREQRAAARSGYVDVTRLLQAPAPPRNGSVGVPIRSLEDVVGESERLALVHLDLEGGELEVLAAASRRMRRDAPLLVLELHVHLRPERTRSLLKLLTDLGYENYLVEEICGLRADCRNLLCVHRSTRHALLGADALDLAIAARALQPVSARTVGDHAFPCCAVGAACCDGRARGCCTHHRVHAWLAERVTRGGADLQWFARTRWFDQPLFTFRQHRWLHALHRREMLRAPNASGLSQGMLP